MSKYKYGIASFKIFDINSSTGAKVGASELDITDDIFRDTFDMTEEDGTETDLYSEMDNTPKLSFREPGKETLAFELMDTTPERLVAFLGGAFVNTAGVKTWSKPANAGIIEKYVEIVVQDGTQMVIPRGKIVAKKNFQFRRNNIWTLDVTIVPLAPEFSGLNAMDIIQPAP